MRLALNLRKMVHARDVQVRDLQAQCEARDKIIQETDLLAKLQRHTSVWPAADFTVIPDEVLWNAPDWDL